MQDSSASGRLIIIRLAILILSVQRPPTRTGGGGVHNVHNCILLVVGNEVMAVMLGYFLFNDVPCYMFTGFLE